MAGASPGRFADRSEALLKGEGLRTRWKAVPILAAVLLWAVPAQADGESLREAGRRLYLTGASSTGERIEARVGAADIALPAERLPCANCHGKDRGGGREGGLSAPDLRWFRLGAPTGTRPAYQPDDLALAITSGIGAGGGALDSAMPRYGLAAEDAAALTAYLASAANDPVPGVAPDRLTIGLLLPKEQTAQVEGQAVAALVRAAFAATNEAGGVFGRRLDLDIRAEGEESEDWSVLGVLSMLPHRAPPSALTAARVPVIGLQAPGGEAPHGTVYVLPGLEQEALGLLHHHARQAAGPQRAAVLLGPDQRLAAVAAAVAGRAERLGWPRPELVMMDAASAPAALARRLEDVGTDVLLVLGGQDRIAELVRAAPNWRPHLLVAGSAVGASLFALPADIQDRLTVAFGLLPSDWNGPDGGRFRELSGRVAAVPGMASLAATHTMARVLVEAVTRAGRSLDRDRLAAMLESFGEFASGSTPPLTFRPGRPVGSLGSHVVRLDLRTRQFAGPPVWVATP